MTQDRAHKQAIRARMAETGEPYTVAARNLDAAPSPAASTDSEVTNPHDVSTAVLQFWDDQDELERAYRQHRDAGGTDQVWNQAVEIARADRAAAGDAAAAGELGVAALPADATPAQHARAEALWHPVPVGLPCRCSGPCHHGQPCTTEADDEDRRCLGRLVHVDRVPGALFELTVWTDEYECDTCGGRGIVSGITLPAIPWGEYVDRDGHNTLTPYADVRHPNFKDTWPGYDPEAGSPAGDGVCRGCGSYALGGYLCDGCRAMGWTDQGGWVEKPDPDERQDVCEECGADTSMGSYEVCACV
jgi:hypothetical protein